MSYFLIALIFFLLGFFVGKLWVTTLEGKTISVKTLCIAIFIAIVVFTFVFFFILRFRIKDAGRIKSTGNIKSPSSLQKQITEPEVIEQ